MTDSCPNCLRREVEPAATHTHGGVQVDGYHCPDCDQLWITSWWLPAYDQHQPATPPAA